MLVPPTSTSQRLGAGSGHEYPRCHAFPLVLSNAHVLGLPFERWSLADLVVNIINKRESQRESMEEKLAPDSYLMST